MTVTHTKQAVRTYQTTGSIAEAKAMSYGETDWWWNLVEERERFTPEGKMACGGLGFDWFYPPNGETPTKALRVCRGCPVRLECLQFALDNNESDGVWGGVTEGHRRKWLKKGWTAEQMIAEQDTKC